MNEESQRIIEEEEAKNKEHKEKKSKLQATNIEVCQKMDKAIKDYNEVKAVIAQLDESRNIMNRLMGPGGVLTEAQRKAFLATDPEEHDRMVNNIGAGGRTALQPPNYLAASGLNPLGARSGSGLLNNPGRDYYNNAGIGAS